MFGIGVPEMMIIGVVAVLLFGSRLPSVARSLGRSLNEFKRGMSDVEHEVKDAIYSEPAGHIENHGTQPESSTPAAKETADTHGN
jgi:sec-independent protein translocase protein TatA